MKYKIYKGNLFYSYWFTEVGLLTVKLTTIFSRII